MSFQDSAARGAKNIADSKNLLFDYYDEIKNPDGYYYCVEFSWDVCERMYNRIDKAYAEWSALFDHDTDYYEDDDNYEAIAEVFSNYFDTKLEVYRTGKKIKNNITDEYSQKIHPNKFKENDGRKLFLLYLRPIINGTGNYYIEAPTRDQRRTDVIVVYIYLLGIAAFISLICSFNIKKYCLKSKRPRKEIPLIAIMYLVNLFIGCLDTFA